MSGILLWLMEPVRSIIFPNSYVICWKRKLNDQGLWTTACEPAGIKAKLKDLPSAEAAASGNYIYGAGEDRLCV
ncbi:hypothetical protein D3C74_493350 [compost metagenome]